MELVVRPIGFVRSPFREKAEAPRQAILARDVTGTVELLPEYRDALADLEGFDRIWLLFWFEQAAGWRSKVLPPRSEQKRGLFATRSPHRPNPIGLSAVRLERIDDLVLHIRELDLLDGTPVLDIKPYIAYADAFPDARAGWLDEENPADARERPDERVAVEAQAQTRTGARVRAWAVVFEPAAESALAWIESQTGATGQELRQRVTASLALGPQAHAYRRIRQTAEGTVLAVKEWRVRFRVAERTILVERIASGFRQADLARGDQPVHDLHRAFVARFP